jgi:hypothetical protein
VTAPVPDPPPPTASLASRPSRSVRAAVAISPFVFLVHDVEELITLPRWPPVPPPFRDLMATPEPASFAAAIAFLFVLQAAAAAWLILRPSRRAALVFALLAGARLANALTHLARAALGGAYISGAWTAGLLAAPFAVILLVGVGRPLALGGVRWGILLAGAAALQLPVIVTALLFGRWATGLA